MFCSGFLLIYIGTFLRYHVTCFHKPGELADSETIEFLLGQMCSSLCPQKQEPQEIICQHQRGWRHHPAGLWSWNSKDLKQEGISTPPHPQSPTPHHPHNQHHHLHDPDHSTLCPSHLSLHCSSSPQSLSFWPPPPQWVTCCLDLPITLFSSPFSLPGDPHCPKCGPKTQISLFYRYWER